MSEPVTTRRTISDVTGILVGHAHDGEALTGCTVVRVPEGTVAGVDVRGGGPGTRETDLLNPVANVSMVNAIALCGGSAFGLAAATGVVEWLREHGIGYQTSITRVPIVPAAVIFDLGIGRADRWADAALGYAATAAASADVAEGCVGAGMGATVGKIQGMQAAVKGGIGTWSETLADGTIVGALAVCNAFGDVGNGDQIIAGTRNLEQGGFANAMHLMRTSPMQAFFANRQVSQAQAIDNTTLVVVATNADLSKAQTVKLAQMAQDGLARAIRPVHTPFDGDTVFALATGQHPAPHLMILGSVAADVVQHAIVRAVQTAQTMGGIPAMHDIQKADH
ncbi:MAG: P1 family peptidase [Chloroflexaceae bacterium]|nr:P1 family peptidase [Chloroflexaceae bacterium]